MTIRTYHLHSVDQCDMCGAAKSTAKLLGFRLDQSQGLRPREKSGVAVSVFKCSNCDLVYASPEPRPASLDDHYNIPVEEYWNAGQLDASLEILSRYFPQTKKLLDFKPGMKALDVGAGAGRGLIALREAGFDTWAIEPSPSFRAKALEITGLTEDRIALSSVEDAEFLEGQFDFVSFGAVFEHLYDPSKALERSMKWLRPGGIWYAEIPSSKHLTSKIINRYFRAIGTSFATNLSPMHSPFHTHEFTNRTFEIFGQKSGLFEVSGFEYEVCPVRHFPQFLHPILTRIMQQTDGGMQLHIWLRKV